MNHEIRRFMIIFITDGDSNDGDHEKCRKTLTEIKKIIDSKRIKGKKAFILLIGSEAKTNKKL